MKADQTLDCVGIYCPTPIVKTTAMMKEMKTGEVLEVVSDDKRIKLDMPEWCRTTGNEFLGMEEQGREIKVYVRKKHNAK